MKIHVGIFRISTLTLIPIKLGMSPLKLIRNLIRSNVYLSLYLNLIHKWFIRDILNNKSNGALSDNYNKRSIKQCVSKIIQSLTWKTIDNLKMYLYKHNSHLLYFQMHMSLYCMIIRGAYNYSCGKYLLWNKLSIFLFLIWFSQSHLE